MKNQDDKRTISNQYSEVRFVAKKFNIKPSQVYDLKETFGNNRKIIYEHIHYMLLDGRLTPQNKDNGK